MSEIRNRLNTLRRQHMKSGETAALNILKLAENAFMTEETSGKTRKELSDEDVIRVLTNIIKTARKTAKEYETLATNSSDQEWVNKTIARADRENFDADFLSQFVPKPLTEGETRIIVKEKISELGVTSVKEMGRVMGSLKTQPGLDMTIASKIVREELS